MDSVIDCYHRFIADRNTFCSKKTVLFYKDNLLRFLNCLSDYYGIDMNAISADMITLDFLQNYILFLRSGKISNVSVQTYYRAVKVFCSWLHKQDMMKVDYTMQVKTPKAYPEEKIPLSVEEVEVIDRCFDLDTEKGIRNYLIFHLMLDCGLRRGELVTLSKRNIDFENGILSVWGKGSKNRYVPVPGEILSLFQTYFLFYNPSEMVFKSLRSDFFSENTIKQVFKYLKADTGIKRLHPHLLRHTFATSYILGGGNIEFLRILLGHSDIQTTQHYMHVSSNCRLLNINVYRLDPVFFRIFTY